MTRSTATRTTQPTRGKAAGKESFLLKLGAPARRALQSHGITSPRALARFTEAEILALHGVGPSSLPALRSVLGSEGLTFKAATQ